MGPETAETWLANVFPTLLQTLENNKLIKKCFYLRYLDPSFHLRIRFELVKTEYFGSVVQFCRRLSEDLYEEELIWKTEIGSYERELERYGHDWMENAEEIFSYDTKFWLSILPQLREDSDGENKRWQAALLSAHSILNDFNFPMDGRIELLKRMVDTLSVEIGGGKTLRLQIDKELRKHRAKLESMLSSPEAFDLEGFSKAVELRSELIREKLSINDRADSWDTITKENRASDLIHLSFNRGLRSKYRMHELVIYSFLKHLYVSAMARSLPYWE